jgi:hypothetical protein
MKAWIFMMWMLCAAAPAQQAVTLAWDASPDAAHMAAYRVHFGEASRGYVFSTNAGLSLTQTVTVPYPADWFFAVTAVGTNQLESDFSNEVMWRALPQAPSAQGDTFVRITPVLERSTNLVEWREFSATPTYVPATNAMEFFKNKRLTIERVSLIGEGASDD